MFKPCIIIPIYNHANQLKKFIPKLKKWPIIIIDDGNNDEQKSVLMDIKNLYGTEILCLPTNRGKGIAILKGLQFALDNGYTHALQIDADGQHDMSDIPHFLELAEKNPQGIINGIPVYDDTVPFSRHMGRKITNFWVAIETTSLDIKDAMCGFRLYPLSEMKFILEKKLFTNRMATDIELIVRSHWEKIKIINYPTKVTYPENGSSNFKMLRDNVKITILHMILVLNMFLRKIKQI